LPKLKKTWREKLNDTRGGSREGGPKIGKI
jgi:hypothetical protein